MALYWIRLAIAICLITPSLCLNPGTQTARSRLFDHDLSATDNLQSWEDWQAKRNLDGHHWDVGQLPPGTFQNWNEWFAKRGLAIPSGADNFGLFDKSRLQEWQDWMAKRGLGTKTPFTGFSDLDKGQFQQWNDWISKRFYDVGGAGFGHGPSTNTGLQNWEDVVKRQNFISPSSDFRGSGKAYFQDWQDWVKRMGPDKAYALNGYPSAKSDRFIKRQLGFSPERFGSFSRYFTDGLQDWRSTFKGMKRDKNKTEQKSEQQ
ncbi:unnamed protein product [Candidula unifasciata]|uniref:Uncharacterized protein n=1 Tax=Candidula unifasciata TaxID=100452 RepID=A0A8S3Z7Q9_9EUPU|nr:unnamed protein product [Candidula unifasciata]